MCRSAGVGDVLVLVPELVIGVVRALVSAPWATTWMLLEGCGVGDRRAACRAACGSIRQRHSEAADHDFNAASPTSGQVFADQSVAG